MRAGERRAYAERTSPTPKLHLSYTRATTPTPNLQACCEGGTKRQGSLQAYTRRAIAVVCLSARRHMVVRGLGRAFLCLSVCLSVCLSLLYAARRAGERAGRLGLGLPAAGWAARNGGGTKVAPEVAEAEGPL